MLEDFVLHVPKWCGCVWVSWIKLGACEQFRVEGIRQLARSSEKYETLSYGGLPMVSVASLNAEDRPKWSVPLAGMVARYTNFLREAGFDVLWAGNFVDQDGF